MANVFYNKASVYQAENVKLFPGVNVIPDEQLDKFLANPGVKDRVAKGVISVEVTGQAGQLDNGTEKAKGKK